MKHNISITMDQKLFRELENIRGREKRSTFIEHLIVEGLKAHLNNQRNTKQTLPITLLLDNDKRKKEFSG
jgi:metal-responsive CopG/Arc/MetJ family transcriptional regulator